MGSRIQCRALPKHLAPGLPMSLKYGIRKILYYGSHHLFYERLMKLNILLLCNKPKVGKDANTIVDHIEAFECYSGHRIWLYSNLGDLPDKLQLNKFDVIIIHYSLCLLYRSYISKKSKRKLRNYSGLKVVFIQDEYRQINKMIDELAFLKIDTLFTCFPEHEMHRVYEETKLPGVSKYSNLTGYIPQRLTDINNIPPPMNTRPLHVGYRGRQLPFWYGALAYEKWNIVEKWMQYAHRDDLRIDVSFNERDRLYGEEWINFLSSCKTTLGVESGASVMDFTGELEKIIDMYQLMHPNETFHSVQKKYLSEHENKYKLNQISPRCFEAIALKTVLVLYEGEYSNILIPGRHYIALRKDFSNIEDVLSCIRDDDFLQNMADVAYQEIALNPQYSYQTFIERVDGILSSEFTARAKKSVIDPYEKSLFQHDINHVSLKNKLYKIGLIKYQKFPQGLRRVVKGCVRPELVVRYLARRFFSLLHPAQKEKINVNKNDPT